jgi:kynurenine formamidase
VGKVQLVDLSHPFGFGVPLWPYFSDVIIERIHYHAKAGVLTQKLTMTMHTSTHADSPAHVFEGGQYTDEIPLEKYYGTGVVVDIPKKQWGVITAEDLEKARPKIQKGDIVIVHTHWHSYYGDNTKYFCYSPGLYKEAGDWFVKKGVKCVGVDQQALDHPLATAIGYHGLGPLRKDVCDEYQKKTGKDPKKEFALWEPCHHALLENGIMGYENVGGDIDKVLGKRVTLAGFPIRWTKGDGSIVRLVAMVDSGDQ